MIQAINERTKCVVQITLTTYDEDLCKKIEPNVCTTRERFEALKQLRDAGIPTIVWLCPILPFINDTAENITGILDYCIEAEVYSVICFGMGLTLRPDSLYDIIVELEEKIEDVKLLRKAVEQDAITLENIYTLLANFDKVYGKISDEEKKSLISSLIKEIEIFPCDESELPLKSILFNFPVYKDECVKKSL